MPLHERGRVFSIVAWDMNNFGDGAFEKLCQIYAYSLDRDGMLVGDRGVSDDVSMTGIEGSVQRGRNILAVSKAVNGGKIGYSERLAAYNNVAPILGLQKEVA
ncbi:hypothetical protein [Burkholderia lata]|uniref:hypothetical protein n=1 Tax=Burkholderia lata (strain ATCC 17760 / DSM 23089 / LMG 22485 / NCIMB 9086 / R18194 / 383) TaxID=482957 RepID=UPI0015839E1C|nr:hypothetical protein [Burkholderia lata]